MKVRIRWDGHQESGCYVGTVLHIGGTAIVLQHEDGDIARYLWSLPNIRVRVFGSTLDKSEQG